MNKDKSQQLFLILLLPAFAFPQNKNENFNAVDSFVKTVKYKNDLFALTNTLTNPYSEQVYKARAIFRWITANIGYNYKYYNKYYYRGKEPKSFKCKGEKNCEAERIAWETKYINNVLQNKKTVCQGYAMLFKKMCDIAGLQSEIIPGYVRTEYYQVGTAGTLDHAWNVILIDSTYYLLDATWAAGFCTKDENEKLLSFSKDYNDYYWLTSPSDFVRNHYPQNDKWTLLYNYSKDSFALNPYYAPHEIKNIKLISPASGVINVTKGDTIHFKIDYAGFFKDLQINTNLFRNPDIWTWNDISKRKRVRMLDTFAVKKQQYVNYEKNNNLYSFDYVVTDNSLYYLDILFDRQRVMRFKVLMPNK